MTRWTDDWQYWEDLLNGDNDYDDMKMSYKLQYGESEYLYEGIQCFVYKQNATPEYETITTVKDCENQVFDNDDKKYVYDSYRSVDDEDFL